MSYAVKTAVDRITRVEQGRGTMHRQTLDSADSARSEWYSVASLADEFWWSHTLPQPHLHDNLSRRPVVAVIDDDAPTRQIVGELLTDEGFEPALWDGMQDPQDFIAGTDPSAIVIDLNLGARRSGIQIIDALRREDGRVRIPIIVCTADQRALDTHGQALVASSCTLLAKPFDLDNLARAVRACTTRSVQS
jgi:CheY-like chemotaxis protein